MNKQDKKIRLGIKNKDYYAISLKTLSDLLDAHRSSVRRWLNQARIKPIVMGKGKNGAVRYRRKDIHEWLESRQYAD